MKNTELKTVAVELPKNAFVQDLEQKFQESKSSIIVDCDQLDREFDKIYDEYARHGCSNLEYIKRFRAKLKYLLHDYKYNNCEILNQQQFSAFIESKLAYLNNMVVEGDKIKIFKSQEEKNNYSKELHTVSKSGLTVESK